MHVRNSNERAEYRSAMPHAPPRERTDARRYRAAASARKPHAHAARSSCLSYCVITAIESSSVHAREGARKRAARLGPKHWVHAFERVKETSDLILRARLRPKGETGVSKDGPGARI